MRRHTLRTRAVIGGALVAAFVLAGCQSPPEPEVEGPGCAPEGAASVSVRAEGELFTKPEVTFPTPAQPLTTERSVLLPGDGDRVALGDIVTVEFVAFNGATGEPLESTGYGAPGIGRTLLTLDADTAMPGIRRALLCSTEGSRVAAVVHPEDGVGELGSAIGVGAGEPVVYVFDIVSLAPTRADGEPQPLDPALPVVEEAESGPPTIAVPATAPPTGLVAANVLLGTGPIVRDGSDVVIRYQAVLWRNGLSFEENWSRARPSRVALSELLPGVAQALMGRTVGSRVLAVVPPEFGFGRDGDLGSSVTGSDTLVYVVDILAAT